MKTSRRLILALLLATTSSSLQAATFTWSGGALLGSQWSRDNNWTTGAPPSNGTADLLFTGSDLLDAEADSNWSIRSITFDAVSAVSGFSIQGSTLTIGSGGITNNDSKVQVISNNIVLSSAQTWTASSGSIQANGPVNMNGHLLTFNSSIGKRVTVDNAISGAAGVTFDGGGQLSFTGGSPNTYTGVTTINNGQLTLQKTTGVTAIAGPLVIGNGTASCNLFVPVANQIANSSDVTVNSFAILDVREQEAIAALTINGGSVILLFATSSRTASGVTMTGGNIGANDPGRLILNGNLATNASSGTASINAILDLNGGTRTLNVASGTAPVDLQSTGSINNGGLIKTGAGTLRLTGGAANTYAGSTTVNAGTLELFKTAGQSAINGPLHIGDGIGVDTVRLQAGEQITNTKSVTIQGGVLDLNGFNETIADLTMEGGTVNTGAGALTLGGNVVASASGVVAPTINGNLHLGVATRTFTVNDVAAAPIDLEVAAVVSTISGATGIIKDGAGTLLLSGTNTYPGGLTLNAGELALGSNSAGGTGALTLNAGIVRATGAARTLANAVTLGGNITIGGALNLSFNGPSFLTGDRILSISNTGLTTFAAIGQNSSGRALTKTGAGTLVLSGANTYSGGTTVIQGKLISLGSLAISSGVLVADGAIFEAANPQSLTALNVSSGGLAILSSITPTFLNTKSLALAGTGALDMNQRAMAVNYDPGQSPLAALRASIISGYAGGTWTGPGIRSSTAAANSNFAIGYAEAFDILGPAGGTFLGQSVDGDTVLIRTTLAGDANLDGQVGFADLVKVAQNYNNNSGTATWNIGDFDYDGNVGFADLVKVAQHYNDTFPTGAAIPGAAADFDQDLARAFAEVPEPGAVALLCTAWGLALRRRRRSYLWNDQTAVQRKIKRTKSNLP